MLHFVERKKEKNEINDFVLKTTSRLLQEGVNSGLCNSVGIQIYNLFDRCEEGQLTKIQVEGKKKTFILDL